MELIQAENFAKVAKLDKLGGKNTAKILMSLFQLDKINQIYDRHYQKDTLSFTHDVLNDAGIKYRLNSRELEKLPKEGGFIIVANHPYGGVEGLILLDSLSSIRPDFKIMANFLFNWIDPLKDKFFGVNPFETHKNAFSSFHGLKKALNHVRSGHPLVIFPAGEVSTYYDKTKLIADRPWNDSIVRFIKNAEAPVVPVYFHGSNSWLFHLMGKVHPLLRTVKIPSELLNKQHEAIDIRIGSPIPVNEQSEFSDVTKYGRYLRARTYALSALHENKELPATNPLNVEPVVKPVNSLELSYQILDITPRYQLFQWQQYKVYCAPSSVIPEITAEIGRLREITFREVGEGTLQSTDVDEFDAYYYQLFIWDSAEQRIAGGYRIGFGKEILQRFGMKGFYSQTLFRMDKDLYPILNESIELGRSFIIKEYQRKPMSLFMLWKGILCLLQKHYGYNYLIGPVSISNNYSGISKEIIVEYIKKYYFEHSFAKSIKSRRPFVPKPSNLDTEILINNTSNFNKLDQILKDADPLNPKMPILLRKYLELGAKITAFNVDPQFNNCVDGLMVLDLSVVKPEIVSTLAKSLDK